MAKVVSERVTIQSRRGMELINITDLVREKAEGSGVREGLLNVFSLHTTAGLMINEAEEGLERDVLQALEDLIPEDRDYHHHHFHYKDGRMAVNAWAHLRSILLGPSLTIPVKDGKPMLGARENVYFVEMDGPKERSLVVQVIGV
ncbi:TPA: YjbQ family protein [Candidatus Bathyarchaeota archaeon]|nr:YjbQ family protein [Candidatus Bathyarchaeota archaeon]